MTKQKARVIINMYAIALPPCGRAEKEIIMTKKIKLTVLALSVLLSIVMLLSACGEGEHTHGNFTNEQIVLAPTCTADGKGTHVCGDCQETLEFTIPALGHTEVIDAGVDYTCTEDGISEGKHCSVCNEVLVAQTTLPAAHRPSEWQVIKAASCEIDGYRIKTCTACEEQTHSEVIAKLGHAESDWVIIKAATCENEGKKQTTCLNCETVMQSVTIDALGHDKTDWITTTAPTCTSSGLKHKGCTRCSETFEQTSIASLGHLCTDTVVAPTCTLDGYTSHDCTRCDYSYTTDTVTKLGHNYSTSVVAPTCTDRGYTQHTCSRCAVGTDGHDYRDTYVSPLGHQYDNGVVTAPTCLDRGYTTYTCIRCEAGTEGHSYKDNYENPLGHQYGIGVVTQPTCTERGYTTYTCSRCEAGTEGHSYKDSYVDALGHQYAEKILENPTCVKAGSKNKTCVRCPAVEPGSAEAIPATGHSISPSIETKDMGYGTTRTATVYRCAGCTEYVHVSKVVFSFDKSPAQRIDSHTGYSYGMSLDYSDLTTQSVDSFHLYTAFSFTKTGDLEAHYWIASKGNMDKAIGFFSGIDEKFATIGNEIDSIHTQEENKKHEKSITVDKNELTSSNIYFVFLNQNYFNHMVVTNITATATFDFGEPKT